MGKGLGWRHSGHKEKEGIGLNRASKWEAGPDIGTVTRPWGSGSPVTCGATVP